MPIRERLAAKEIHRDWRRLRSISNAAGGSVAPHTLLGVVHSDTAINAPSRGAMILADSTPEWTALEHPLATGYALVTDATDVAWDVDPEWRGRHSWHDGAGVTAYIDEDGTADFDGHVAIGPNATVQTNVVLYMRNTALDSTESNYGVFLDLVKTAGATDTSDILTGIYSRAYLNQAAGTVGQMRGINAISRVDDGNVGSGGVPRDVFGVDCTVDLNGGQIYDDAIGLRGFVDQEAANTVSGDVIGILSQVDADGTVTGTAYLAKLEGSSNVDYGVYETGAAENYLQNDTKVGGTAGASAQLHVDQSNASGAQPVLLLDQGDVSEQHIVASSDSVDRDFPAILQLDVTGTPTLGWDESDDKWTLTKNLSLLDGDLYLASGLGIIHADGVLAGQVLLANGTRYVPAAANTNLPVAPSGRGYILRSDATPAWGEYLANTLGAVLIGDGNDIVSDTTPTFVDSVTLDDGAGNSPGLYFVGGSNDDAFRLQCIDDAVAENSDMILLMPAADADCQWRWVNKFTNPVAWVDAAGDAAFSEHIYHVADADTYVQFQDDNITLAAGGVNLLDLIEAATNSVLFGAQADLNGNDLIIDADGDTYLHEVADDQAELVIAGNAQYNFNATDLTITSAGATDAIKFRTGADVTAAAYIWFDTDSAISSAGNLTMLIDSNNNETDRTFEIAHNADSRQSGVSGTPLWVVNESNYVYQRLVTVDHGLGTTVFQHTDVFGQIQIVDTASGGLMISGGKDPDGTNASALVLRAFLDENVDTTKSTTGRSLVEVQGYQTNGAIAGNVVADGNVFGVQALTGGTLTTLFIVDEDGDLWAPGLADFSDAGIRTVWSEANVSSPPTDAELDATFGTPAAVGEGFHALVDDNNANTAGWAVWSLGGSWWYAAALTKAV